MHEPQAEEEIPGMGEIPRLEVPRIAPPIRGRAGVEIDFEKEGMVLTTIRAFYRWLMPPPPHANPEERHNWDRRLGLTVFSLTLMFALTVCAEYDLVPWLDGFARQSSMASLSNQIVSVESKMVAGDQATSAKLTFIQTQAIETAIDAKIKLRCLTSDGQEVADLSEDIRHLEDKYWILTKGQGYRQPTCYEVGIGKAP